MVVVVTVVETRRTRTNASSCESPMRGWMEKKSRGNVWDCMTAPPFIHVRPRWRTFSFAFESREDQRALCACARACTSESTRVCVCVHMCVCVLSLFLNSTHSQKKSKISLYSTLLLSTGCCRISRLYHPLSPSSDADAAHASSSHQCACVCASSTNFRSSVLFISSPPRRAPLSVEKVDDEFVVKVEAEAEGCFWFFLARNAAAAFADPGTQDRALVRSCIRWTYHVFA